MKHLLPAILGAATLASTWVAIVPSIALALDPVPETRLDDQLRCHLGVYSLPEGATVTLTGASGAPRAFQYTLSDGRFGTIQEVAPGIFSAGLLTVELGSCVTGTIRMAWPDVVLAGTKMGLISRETQFTSDGISLYGRLILPAGGRTDLIAVWVEGSNNNASTDDAVWPWQLAARGIGVFVYDKRGTGQSGGMLTADFQARARDTAQAVATAQAMVPHARRFGVVGASQGGWVAPLVATLEPLDFVVTVFALAEGPIGQDRALVEQQVRSAGFGEDDVAKSRILASITERIVRTNLQEGPMLAAAFADLDAFKAAHAGEAWLAAIQPRSYTGIFLLYSTEQLRAAGPAMAQGLSFDYEPRPVIEQITSRQLWLLGGADTQAPNTGTQAILADIQRTRRDIEVVVFEAADHGLVEMRMTDAGLVPVYAANQFDIAARWIIGSADTGAALPDPPASDRGTDR